MEKERDRKISKKYYAFFTNDISKYIYNQF